jgi:hypothetical protein
MKSIIQFMGSRLSTDRIDLRIAQGLSFATGPAIMIVAITGLARMARTPAEVLIGVLAATGTGMTFILMGLVLGLMAEKRP